VLSQKASSCHSVVPIETVDALRDPHRTTLLSISFYRRVIMRTLIYFFLSFMLVASVNAQAPPSDPVRLVFIHHSTGEGWLTIGGLRDALNENNYYVTDTNYGWGPDGIGDLTDIGHWYNWFLSQNRDAYMEALYDNNHISESLGRNIIPDPGGGNTVVMFKSCFPNSYVTSGNPGDPPLPPGQPNLIQGASVDLIRYYSVSNIKGLYRDLLDYFVTQQDKLFVLITTPPLLEESTDPDAAARHRDITMWLVHDWLAEYRHNNVFVFDYYNVLTSNGGDFDTNDLGAETGNHHRLGIRDIEHVVGLDNNFLAYGLRGNSHPTAAGQQKATEEFVPLLNVACSQWRGTSEPDEPGEEPDANVEGILAEIEAAMGDIQKYNLVMERHDGSGYVSTAEVDIEEKATHSVVRIGLESPREVEYYWIGEDAYGMRPDIGTWFRMSVPGEPINRLENVFALLRTGEVTGMVEENLEGEPCWVLFVEPDVSQLRDNAEHYANGLFPMHSEGTEKDKELLAKVEEAMREVEMHAEFWVSRRSLHIKEVFLSTVVFGNEKMTAYHISDINNTELQISPPAEALKAEGTPIPLGALFMQLPKFE